MGETFLVKIKKNNHSLYNTLPPSIIELFEIKEGDMVKLEFIEILKKGKGEKK